MKASITILLLSLVGQSFGQNYFLQSLRKEGTIPVTQPYIYYTDPTPTHGVWRAGTEYTGTVTPPTGYSTTWEIYEMGSWVLIDSGSGNSITKTFSYDTGSNVYAFIFEMTKSGADTLWKFVPRTVYPALFTEGEADEVWDLSSGGIGSHSGGHINRPGYKIFVKGTYSGSSPLQLYWWSNNDESDPIHLLFDPSSQVQLTSSYATPFSIGADIQNMIIDGSGNESIEYGFKISSTGAGQVVYILGGDGSSTLGTAGKNIRISGLDIDGNNVSSAGITIQTSGNATLNYSTYWFDTFHLHHCRVQNTFDELFYLGHFTDSPNPTYSWSPIINGMCYNLIGINGGNDGYQYGSFINSQNWNIYINNAGTRDQPDHRNALQWSNGNRNCSLFMSYFEGASAGFSGFSGLYGTDQEFFSNIFNITGGSSKVRMFFRLDENDSVSNVSYKFFNNTMMFSAGVPFELWKATAGVTTTGNPFVMADNLVGSNTVTTYSTFNSFNSGWIIDNQLQYTDTTLFDFVGPDNYHLASLSSPAFRAKTSFTKVHPLSDYDYEGVKTQTDYSGAYSGYELYDIAGDPPEEAIGEIFSETFAVSIPSEFTNAGSSGITYSAGELNFTGGAGTFVKTLQFTDATNPHHYTCLEEWSQTVWVRTPASLSAAYGLGIGVKSSNSYDALSTLVRWAWDDSGKIYTYYRDQLGTQVNDTGFIPSTSTWYIVEVTRTKNVINTQIWDETHTTQHANVTRTFATTYPNDLRANNTGRFTLYNFGGTNFKVKNWSVSSDSEKYVDIVAIGDSNMYGLFCGATYSNRYIDQSITTKSYTVLAGIGDRTADILNRIDEIIALCKPSTIIYLNIGSNDVGSGVPQATYEAQYNSILSALSSYTVVLGTAIARSDVDLQTLNTFISGKSGSYSIIDLFTTTKSGAYQLNATYNAGDNIHLNLAGHNACVSPTSTVLDP